MVEIERLDRDIATDFDLPTDPTHTELLSDPMNHDVWRLKTLIARHARLTNSSRAQEILDDFDEFLPRFYKVVPVEYRRALEQRSFLAVESG